MPPAKSPSDEVLVDLTPEEMAESGARVFSMFMGLQERVPVEHFLTAATNARIRIHEHLVTERPIERPILAQEIYGWAGGKDFLSDHPAKEQVAWGLVAGLWVSCLTTEKSAFNIGDIERAGIGWAKADLEKKARPEKTDAAPGIGELVDMTIKHVNRERLKAEDVLPKAEMNGHYPKVHTNGQFSKATGVRAIIALKIHDYELKIAALRRTLETLTPEVDAALGDIMADLAGVKPKGD